MNVLRHWLTDNLVISQFQEAIVNGNEPKEIERLESAIQSLLLISGLYEFGSEITQAEIQIAEDSINVISAYLRTPFSLSDLS